MEEEAESLGNRHFRVLIAGFSQGCAMNMHVALIHKQSLGRVVDLSGYLLSLTPVPAKLCKCLFAHSTAGKFISSELTLKLYERDGFRAKRKVSLYKVFGMDHSICPEVIRIMKRFIKES